MAIILFTFRKYFGLEVGILNATLSNISQSTGGWFN